MFIILTSGLFPSRFPTKNPVIISHLSDLPCYVISLIIQFLPLSQVHMLSTFPFTLQRYSTPTQLQHTRTEAGPHPDRRATPPSRSELTWAQL
jgi:hypothetical protein